MPSQNNTGRQYDKQHAVTLVAIASLAAHRFVSYNGAYPVMGLGNNGLDSVQGVSESAADSSDAVSVITGYSALVESAQAIDRGALVASDESGRAMAGSSTYFCGRALGAATAAGQLIEVQVLQGVYA